MLTLGELHDDSCRWPVAEVRGVHLFCGETAVSAKPYCECHLRLAGRKWPQELIGADRGQLTPADHGTLPMRDAEVSKL
jgi:hypothetical protein